MTKKVLENSDQYGLVLAPEFQDMDVEVYNVEGPSKYTIEAKITTAGTILYSYGNRARAIEEQKTSIVGLLTDPENMKSVGDGVPPKKESAEARFDERAGRFRTGNPFSAFTVENEDDKFVGHVIAGSAGKHPITGEQLTGRSELAIVIDKDEQKKGHGNRAIAGITYAWGNHLARHDYKVNGEDNLVAFWATANPENGSSKIFGANGYNKISTFEHPLYKSPRNEYELSTDHIVAVFGNTGRKLRA